jgi:hypothetical protein
MGAMICMAFSTPAIDSGQRIINGKMELNTYLFYFIAVNSSKKGVRQG